MFLHRLCCCMSTFTPNATASFKGRKTSDHVVTSLLQRRHLATFSQSEKKKKIPNMCSSFLSKKKPNFPGMHPTLLNPPPPHPTTTTTHNRRPAAAVAFPMCLRVCIERDGRLGGFGVFLNLQGPKLLAGNPSLFCIVGSVLRTDLESVLTGNQQFLR